MNSDEKYHSYHNVQCAVVIADGEVYPHHKLSIKFVNRHFTSLFGYKADEVVGRDVAYLAYRAVDRDMHQACVQTFCETGMDRVPAGIGRTVDGRHRDGACMPLTLTLHKLPGNEYAAFFSAPATTFASATESTGSGAPLESSKSNLAFFDTFMTAIVHATYKAGELYITYSNKAVTSLFGYSREECRGMKVVGLIFDPELASRHNEYVRIYEETGIGHGVVDNDAGRAVTGRHKDGYVGGHASRIRTCRIRTGFCDTRSGALITTCAPRLLAGITVDALTRLMSPGGCVHAQSSTLAYFPDAAGMGCACACAFAR
jgi:PAS domain S-box-containing protein